MNTRRVAVPLLTLWLLAACEPAAEEPAADGAPEAVVDEETPDATDADGAEATDDLLPCDRANLEITQPVPSLSFSNIDVAVSQGFFEDYGLSVTQHTTLAGGPDVAALITGDVDFNAQSGTYQIDAYREGQRDLMAVYHTLDGNPIGMAISAEVAEEAGITTESPIEERIQALDGRTIGNISPGDLTFALARYMLDVVGANAEIVAVGGGAPMIAAYSEGRVDAIITGPPTPETLVETVGGVLIYGYEVPGLDRFMGTNIHTMRSFMEEHPGCVQRFVHALYEGSQWVLSHEPEEVVEALGEGFAVFDQDRLIEGVATIQRVMSSDGIQTIEAVENTLLVMGYEDVTAEDIMSAWTDEFVPRE